MLLCFYSRFVNGLRPSDREGRIPENRGFLRFSHLKLKSERCKQNARGVLCDKRGVLGRNVLVLAGNCRIMSEPVGDRHSHIFHTAEGFDCVCSLECVAQG